MSLSCPIRKWLSTSMFSLSLLFKFPCWVLFLHNELPCFDPFTFFCDVKNAPCLWWLIKFFFCRPPFLWLMFWHQAGLVYHWNSCNRLVYSATYSICLFSETRMSLHMAHWLFHITQKFQGSFYLDFLALYIPHCLPWYCHSCWFIFLLLTLYTVIR